jgi:hypothetical protein
LQGADERDSAWAVLLPEQSRSAAVQKLRFYVIANSSGMVAFEALYRESQKGPLRGGIFVDARFIREFELSHTGAATEFTLADSGDVFLRDGVIAPKVRRPPITGGVFMALVRAKNAAFNKIIPRNYQDIFGQVSNALDIDIWDKMTATTNSAKDPKAPPKESKSCPSPAYPFPGEWAIGSESTGPVAGRSFEQPNPSRAYDSPFYGHIVSPFRQIQFNSSCEVLTVAIGFPNGQFEVRTPKGLLTHKGPNGAFVLPGFSQTVTSGSFLQSDSAFIYNRRNQIALRVVTENGFALLLATPTALAN